jgi:hypothetical protein
MTTGLPPLWGKHPDLPWGCLGWRMGWGEVYWEDWRSFFLALGEEDRRRYREVWPEPEPWQGLYAFIETGEPPPWVVEHKRKLAGPYPLPSTDESRISEHYRVVWLIRQHLIELSNQEVHARVSESVLKQARGEDHLAFYAEPNGSWWRFSTLKAGGWLLQRLAVPHESHAPSEQ